MTDNSASLEVPPGMYFKAKDLAAPRHVDNGASAHDVETGRRNSHLGRCIARVEALARDLRSLKSFDEMGNVELAAEQVSSRMDDTASLVDELLGDIERASARFLRKTEAPTDAINDSSRASKWDVPRFEGHASLPEGSFPDTYPPPGQPQLSPTAVTPSTVFGGNRG